MTSTSFGEFNTTLLLKLEHPSKTLSTVVSSSDTSVTSLFKEAQFLNNFLAVVTLVNNMVILKLAKLEQSSKVLSKLVNTAKAGSVFVEDKVILVILVPLKER